MRNTISKQIFICWSINRENVYIKWKLWLINNSVTRVTYKLFAVTSSKASFPWRVEVNDFSLSFGSTAQSRYDPIEIWFLILFYQFEFMLFLISLWPSLGPVYFCFLHILLHFCFLFNFLYPSSHVFFLLLRAILPSSDDDCRFTGLDTLQSSNFFYRYFCLVHLVLLPCSALILHSFISGHFVK